MPFSKLKGRKVMLCDMIYQKPSKKTNWKDYLTVIYKDLVKDTKEKMIIEEPTIDLFTVKPEYRTFGKQRHFIPREQLDVKTVKYRNVLYEIAKIAGNQWLEYYNDHPDFKSRKRLYKYPFCVGGDIDIETYYRTIWNEQCPNDGRKVPSRIFLDIETDQIDYEGDIAKHGECPINAVTVTDEKDNTVYTFLLNNPNNPQIKEFMEHQPEFQKELHEMFDETYGVLTYKLYMFDDEVEMLTQLFNLIHSLARDFCLIWNMGFDIPYIIGRLETLGVDPATIMCANDFPTETLYYFEDKRSFDFANKRDFFAISDMTHYGDQPVNYASLRKSQGAVKRVNLGAIGKEVLKDTKLDYSDEGNIRTLPYDNYKRFIAYNIKD